jgi:hypothetical protein
VSKLVKSDKVVKEKGGRCGAITSTLTAPSKPTLAAITSFNDTPSSNTTTSCLCTSPGDVTDWEMDSEREEFMERVKQEWEEYEALGLDMEEEVDAVLKEEMDLFL